MKKNIISLKSNDVKENSKLKMHYSGIMRFIPLIIVGGFYFFTILLFAFGPLKWNIDNAPKLYTFLLSTCLALISGYLVSVYKTRDYENKANIDINKVLIIGCFVYLILYIPTLLVTTGKWYPDIVTGIMDTGKAYRISKYYNDNSSPVVLYIRMILSPFMISVIPITLFYWPKITRLGRALGVSVLILTIFMSIAQGTNKAVADFTAQIVMILFMLLFSNVEHKSKIKYRFKMVLLIILVCLMFFLYYANSMKNRVSMDISMSEQGINGENFKPSKAPNKKVDKKQLDDAIERNYKFSVSSEKENYLLFKPIPEKIRPMLTYLTSYLSHGYVGLSYSLEQDFTSAYGLGFSDFFRHNILKVVNKSYLEKSVVSRTYQYKIIEEGWETGGVWSTFFVYPASDITFYGVIGLVFIIGFLFGLSWKEALKNENPFALASFFCFTTMIFYFSANNQMFQGGENFIGFTVMLICWFVSRYRLIKNQTT